VIVNIENKFTDLPIYFTSEYKKMKKDFYQNEYNLFTVSTI